MDQSSPSHPDASSSANPATGANAPIHRHWTGLLATLPLIVPLAVYLTDIDGWDRGFEYGLIMLVLPVALVAWVFLLCFELVKRRKLASRSMRFPWFSVFGPLLLPAFVPSGKWAVPLATKIPPLCLSTQTVQWNSSKATTGLPRLFQLTLHGPGTKDNYEFKSASMRTPVDGEFFREEIQICQMDLGTFSHNVAPLTPEFIRDRISKSGIPEREVDRIAGEIWHVIELAVKDAPLKAATGSVAPFWSGPWIHSPEILGGAIWMFALVVSFQGIARWSLPPTRRKPEIADPPVLADLQSQSLRVNSTNTSSSVAT